MDKPWSFHLAKQHLLPSSLGVEYYPHYSSLRRVLWLVDDYLLVEFSSTDDISLNVRIHGRPSRQQAREAAIVARRIFGLDQPVREIYVKMAQVKRLKKLTQKYPGLRIFQASSLFEMAATAIIGQQVNLKFTAQVTRQLIELCGNCVQRAKQKYFGFPSAESVSEVSAKSLRAIQFSRRKAEYLIGFAKAIVSGEIDERRLSKLSDEAVCEELMRFRGVGRWTADMILMRALGRLDVLPSLDTGLQAGYALLFHCPRPSSDELVDLTAFWKGFRSYATFYLWALLASERRLSSRIL